MTRSRTEAWFAVFFTAAIVAVGGAALVFVLTISPVHTDPGTVPSTSAAAPPPTYSDAVEQARKLARSLAVEENLPGLSVAVAVDGAIVWAEGFGWADVERRAPVTPVTQFRIGSVSKPITAAAVGVLHERGRIDLDAPVQRYVRAYPAKQWAVSTRQLMGDVAGVHHLRGGHERMPGRHCANLDQALRIFADDALLFQPGTQYRYSIYGWVLVSAVVEGAADEPFAVFMTREVFQRLGMTRTAAREADGSGDRATYYFPRAAMRTDLGLQDAPEADYSCFSGAGAFVSTPSDLVRFGSAMLKPGLLKGETLRLLQTAAPLESGTPTQYALGWNVETVQLAGAPARLLRHRGTPIGATVTLLTFPDLGLAIAAASNVSYAQGVAPFGLKVADAFTRVGTARVREPAGK